jgi:hypothetical protein
MISYEGGTYSRALVDATVTSSTELILHYGIDKTLLTQGIPRSSGTH